MLDFPKTILWSASSCVHISIDIQKLAVKIELNQHFFVPVWRLYFCDQYYQLSDVLLANWSWVIENGISIFPIAGSFHRCTTELGWNHEINFWNYFGWLLVKVVQYLCKQYLYACSQTHQMRYTNKVLADVKNCTLCLLWDKFHWSRCNIHDHGHLESESEVRSWSILRFSDSPISSRVLQNWTHFSNTVPCRPSPV